MDNEMIERCEAAVNKLQDTGKVIGVKQVIIEVIKAMREPTEKMLHSTDMIYKSPEYKIIKECHAVMIDSITND